MAEETIPQMRERIEALEKQVKSLEGDKTDLGKENRLLKARDVFRDQGYDPVHGELFANSTDGEITAEAVNEFAQKFSLNPKSEEQSDGSASDEPTGADSSDDEMDSFSRAGSGAGAGDAAGPSGNTLTRQEYIALAQENPAAAKEAVAAGRVQLRADNPWTR